MGTSNFFNKNASRIFAIGMSYEQPIIDEDGNETDEMETQSIDSYEWEDIKREIKAAIAELPDFNGLGSDYNDRNYYGTNVGELWKYRTYLNFEVGVELQAYVRSGYYEGANLDWEVAYIFEGEKYNDVDDLIEYFIDRADDFAKKGLAVMHSKNVRKYLDTTERYLVDQIEKVFAEQSGVQLEVTARFSNGETIYSKVG
jgi:hypothetical protein